MSHYSTVWHRSGAFKALVFGAVILSALPFGAFLARQTGVASSSAGAPPPGIEQSQFDYAAMATPKPVEARTPAATKMPPEIERARKTVLTPVAPNTAISAPQGTEPPTMMGKTFQANLPIQGREVPLPGGQWTVVAHMPGAIAGAVESIVLAQPRQTQLAGLILVQSSRLAPDQANGYRQWSQCSRTDILHAKVLANENFGRQDCWTINHNLSLEWKALGAPNVLRAAAGDLSVRGIDVPPVMLSVYYRQADKNGMLHAIYFSNPVADGIKSTPTAIWQESDWHRQYIGQYPEKMAYVQKLRSWAEDWHPRIHDAFQRASK